MTPWVLPLLALAGASAVQASGRAERWPERIAVAAAIALLFASIGIAIWPQTAGWTWNGRLGLQLGVSGFGIVMAVLVPAVAAPVISYATVHEAEAGRPRLLAALLLFVGAMELLVLASDLLTLLVGWELVGACSWLLIAHEWRDPARPRSARRAFVATRFGDLGLYLAAGAAFASVGSTGFQELAQLGRPALDIVAAGVLLAAVAKSAQVPFSPWLFAAMAGPTSASALLHSATMVAAGAYLLIRLAPTLAGAAWFLPAVLTIGLVTTLTGAVVALLQRDFKLALAGSTSSQYGLMFVAVGAGSGAAAGAHLVTHAGLKALLFLGAGIAIHAAGNGDLGRMRLGQALPAVAAAVGIGALALAAVPPLGAARSKELVVAAAWEASPWTGGAVLLSGVLTAMYAARLWLLAYGPGAGRTGFRPNRGELWSIWVLALASITLGVLWIPGADRVAARLAGGGLAAGSPGELVAALALIAAGIAVAAALHRRQRLLSVGLSPAIQAGLADWLGLPVLARSWIARPSLELAGALAARIGRTLARLSDSAGELSIDAVVERIATMTAAIARGSGELDDRGVDQAVEGGAAGVDRAGSLTRRLQTGLAHHYYLIVAGGALGAIAVAILWR